MANKIVQLEDRTGDNIYPIAGGTVENAVTKAMLAEGVFEGPELSSPSTVAYVRTENIVDGAVTADKTDRVILWQGTDNGTSAITLSETAANFKYIEVYYHDDQSFKNSIRIFTNNSADAINFCLQSVKTGYDGDAAYLVSKRENLQGTLLTQGHESATTLRNSTAVALTSQTNYTRIEQIIGYRS